MRFIAEFLQSDRGQDLVEYTLLLAFIMLASAALYINAGGSVTGIWTITNSNLNAAASQAAGGS
jgi:Flp pilus assembly pilin Flp